MHNLTSAAPIGGVCQAMIAAMNKVFVFVITNSCVVEKQKPPR